MKLRQHTGARLSSLAALAVLACASISQGVTVICCAGNSVTMTAQYPETLQARLGPLYKVYNEGVGGASASSYPSSAGFADIMNIKPQIITTKFGCNDSHSDSSGLAGAYGTSFVQYYDSLIDKLQAIVPKPQIYLVLPAPMFPPECIIWGDNMQCMLVPLIRSIATQRGLPVIDCNTPFLNGPEFFPNSVHATPGSPAADTLTEVIYRALTGSTVPPQPRPSLNQVTSIAYGNNRFVAVENVGTISTSPDGKTWTRQYSDTVYPLHGVTYANGQFVAVGWNGRFLSSPDGSTWTPKVSGTKETFYSVAYGSSQFVTVGGGYGCAVSTSPDGATWTTSNMGNIPYPPSMWLISVAYGSGRFVAVGSTGQILTSQNGTNWAVADSSAGSAWLTSVVYGNNQFVAVGQCPYGQNAMILTSSDGTNWAQRSSGTTNGLWSVAYGNNEYVAAGAVGTVLTSTDGITWAKMNSGTTKYLTSIAYGNNEFVIGGYGIILTMNGNIVGVASQSGLSKGNDRIAIAIAANSFSVTVPGRLEGDHVSVGLFNTAGKRIYSSDMRIHNRSLNIPTLGLPTGKYFISIADCNAGTFSSEFVLTK